jgi:hypothetical protein
MTLLLGNADEDVQGIGRALQDWAVAGGDLAGPPRHRKRTAGRAGSPLSFARNDGGWGISPSFPVVHATTCGAHSEIFSRLNWPGIQTIQTP